MEPRVLDEGQRVLVVHGFGLKPERWKMRILGKPSALPTLWIVFALLAVATFVAGVIAGYRADEAAGIPAGQVAPDTALTSAALWFLVGATVATGLIALAATFSLRGRGEERLVWPLVLVILGLAGSLMTLFALVLSAAGAVWLVAVAVHRRTVSTAA